MDRNVWFRAWAIPLVVVMLSLASASAAFAQALVGTIAGSVTDSTGGALPGATVTATQATTGLNRTTVTNVEGAFRLDGLPSGRYTVKVEMPSFSPLSVTLPTALAAQEVRDLGKLVMAVGGMSETVEVTGAVTPVQTTESSRKATITEEDVKNIQIKGRDIFGLIQIVPGVQDTNLSRDYATRVSATSVTINGANSYNKDIRVDGMNVIDEGGCGTVTVNLNMDAVAEVQVVSNGYTAENGRSTGGMISLVTKSGTNQFKGSGVYNGRRDRFNSNDFIRIVNNQAKPLYAVNIEGYSFGGPVIIPRLYNSRTVPTKKLYFFLSQEFADNRRPTVTARANLPTALERNGDFSQTYITTGSGANATYSIGPIFDPLTGKQFPGNIIPKAGSPGCGISVSCINPLGQAMLNLQKMPNGILNLEPGNLYSSNSAYDNTPEQDRSNTVLRVDSVLTEKTRMSFRLVRDRDYLWSYNVFSPGSGHTYLTSPGLVLSSNITQVIRPTVVNEMTFGWVHHRYGFMPGEETRPVDKFDYTSLYASNVLPGLTVPRLQPFRAYSDPPKLSAFGGPQQDQWPYAPIYSASASSRSSLGGYMNNCDCPLPRLNMSARATFEDTLSITRGHHTFKLGFSTELDHKTEPGSANYMGNYNFGDDANNPLRTRNGYANMLLGYYTTYTELTARVDKAVRHWETDAFAQDNWRVSPRLTLDYGLRIQHAGSQYEVNDNHTGFWPDQWNAAAAPRVYRLICTSAVANTAACPSASQRTIDPANPTVRYPAAYNGNLVPGSGSAINGISTDGIPGQKPGTYATFPGISWAPRVGFAWDVNGNGKMALRASTGIFYNFAGSSSAQGFSYAWAGGCPVSCTRVIRWGTFQDIANASSQGANFVETPANATVGGISVPNGHSYNANVALQRDLGFDTVAEVAWVGNWMYGPGRNVDDNRLPLNVYGNVDNLFNSSAPVAANNLRTLYGKYPGMGSVTRFVPNLYNQILKYNAMQVTVTRRLSRGLQMGVAYTYAKGNGYTGYDPYIDEIGGAALVKAYFWAPTAEDRAHNLVVNYSYNVPTFSQMPVVKQLISDWQVSGITKMLSGAGVTPTCASNGSGVKNTLPSLTDGLTTGANAGTVACQLTGIDPALNITQNTDKLAYDAQHFNPAAFAFAAPTNVDPKTGIATVGALGSPGTTRMFRNPTWVEWDLTLARRFGITAFGRQNAGLRLQVQVFNLFNSVQFTRLNASMQWTGASGNTALNSPNVGKYDQVMPARVMGLTVRFDW